MIVTLKPIGREEYALSLDGPPRYGSAIFGGYESAELDCQLNDLQRLYAKGGTLRIHGKTGVVWQGIVTRRPGLGEPLTAKGWGWGATLGRRDALFCDTRTSEWRDRTYMLRSEVLQPSIDGPFIRFDFRDGEVYGYPRAGVWRGIPGEGTTRSIYFEWSRPVTDLGIELFYGTGSPIHADGSEASAFTSLWVKAVGDAGLSGWATVSIPSAATSLMFQVDPNNWTATADASIFLAGIKVFGTALTEITTSNVLKNVITNEIPTSFLPAGTSYQAWINTENTVVEPLVFDSCSAEVKAEELTKYASNAYGWYMETVNQAPACVPHWTALSTTPDYIIRLDEAEDHDLDESTIDELYSAVRVGYENTSGRSTYVDVTDIDTTHPLVKLGIVRYGDLPVQTSSTATATSLGQRFVAENGREQVKGTITTRVVRTSNGADVYLPTIRPGRMARIVGLPDGQVDCIIRRANLAGDEIVSIELDNDPYALDLLLARLAKREQ